MFHLDFTNKNLWLLFEIDGEKIYLTQSILSTWIVMGVLILIAVIVRIRIHSFKSIPRGFQNVVEAVVEVIENFTRSTMGKETVFFSGYFLSIFAFIILSNYSSLVGLRPPTSDLATTLALALMTFLLIHTSGFKTKRLKYLKSFLEPIPLFLPLNLIGEIAKPVSLAFRLFGNILSGVIIMGLIYTMLPIALRFILPDVLHLYFDVFVGALQAFIFTVLSMTYIAQATSD